MDIEPFGRVRKKKRQGVSTAIPSRVLDTPDGSVSGNRRVPAVFGGGGDAHRTMPPTPLRAGMADTKRGREEQADEEERRQRDREVSEARARADEAEPPEETADRLDGAQREADDRGSPRTCHRRGCDTPATFAVLERYQEETGHGAVEATALLCQEHADEESPTNLDAAYEDYVFRVALLPPADESDTA